MDPKDVFFIHTKGDQTQRIIVENLIELLHSYIPIWTYGDWNWRSLQTDPGKMIYKSSGIKIDPYRFATRQPKPFVHEGRSLQVDKQTLRKIIIDSMVVVIMEPPDKGISPGVEIEIEILQGIVRSSERHIPIILVFSFEDSKPVPGMKEIPYFKIQIAPFKNEMPESLLINTAALITTLWIIKDLLCRWDIVGRYLIELASNEDKIIKEISRIGPNYTEIDILSFLQEHAQEKSKLRELALKNEKDPFNNARSTLKMAELECRLFNDWWEHEAKSVRDFSYYLHEKVSIFDDKSFQENICFVESLVKLERIINKYWKHTWELIGM